MRPQSKEKLLCKAGNAHTRTGRLLHCTHTPARIGCAECAEVREAALKRAVEGGWGGRQAVLAAPRTSAHFSPSEQGGPVRGNRAPVPLAPSPFCNSEYPPAKRPKNSKYVRTFRQRPLWKHHGRLVLSILAELKGQNGHTGRVDTGS